jgi:hypothetical protein
LLFISQNLAEEEPEKYQSHFSEYIKKGIEADDMEALYKKVHAAIRADPSVVKSTKQPPKEHKRYSSHRLSFLYYGHHNPIICSALTSLLCSSGTTPRN